MDWSAFLVAKANAHADWWDNVADDYASMVLKRNAVETAWQATINAAHAAKELTLRTSSQNEVVNNANAERAKDDMFANAQFAQLAGLLQPGVVYLEAIATANHDLPIHLAEIERNYLQHLNSEVRQTGINAAHSLHQQQVQQARQTWQAHEAAKLATSISTEAGATAVHAGATAINADYAISTDCSH